MSKLAHTDHGAFGTSSVKHNFVLQGGVGTMQTASLPTQADSGVRFEARVLEGLCLAVFSLCLAAAQQAVGTSNGAFPRQQALLAHVRRVQPLASMLLSCFIRAMAA